MASWVECSPMVQETWVQSQVDLYQRLQKWYLMLPCLTLSNIRYISRVKWSNPEKGVAPSLTSYCKGGLLVTFDYGRQLYFYLYVRVAYTESAVLVKCQFLIYVIIEPCSLTHNKNYIYIYTHTREKIIFFCLTVYQPYSVINTKYWIFQMSKVFFFVFVIL